MAGEDGGIISTLLEKNNYITALVKKRGVCERNKYLIKFVHTYCRYTVPVNANSVI